MSEEQKIDNNDVVEESAYIEHTEKVDNSPAIKIDIDKGLLKEKQPKEQPKATQPLWVTMFAIVGIFIGATLVGAFIKLLLEKTATANAGFADFVTYLFVFLVTIVFAVWILIARGSKRPILAFTIKKVDPTIVLWGLVLLIVTSMVIEPLIALFPSTNLELLKNMVSTGGWAMLTTIVAAPILEEILFRGILQESVTREYGAVKGLLFASAIFAIAHMAVPQQAVNAFFMAIILGYIYLKTKSLIPVIIIHAINNGIAYLMMSIFNDSIVMTRDVVGNDTIYWIIYSICVVIVIVAAVNITRHISKVNKEQSETKAL